MNAVGIRCENDVKIEQNLLDDVLAVLCQIADGLDIPRSLVTHILDGSTELD